MKGCEIFQLAITGRDGRTPLRLTVAVTAIMLLWLSLVA
jgi:hypothetical protein